MNEGVSRVNNIVCGVTSVVGVKGCVPGVNYIASGVNH